MAEIKYYGAGGAILASAGELVTDRRGLVSGRCLFKVRPGDWRGMPALGAVHPYANFCHLERRAVSFTKGFWAVTGEYVGCEGEETQPIYDWNPGVGTEPIEITKNFVTQIAGKPSAPLNGAIFLDERGDLTEDDKAGVFEKFRLLTPEGNVNPYAGTEVFMTLNNGVYSKSWVRKVKPNESGGSEKPLSIVTSPPGPQPQFGGSYNWLEYPVAYTSRGAVYECKQNWLLSGPKGFNTVIYSE